jgi:protein involved in polysaccharide export with SLBB domain
MLVFLCAGLLPAPGTAYATGSGDVLQLNVANGTTVTNKYIYKEISNNGFTFHTGDYIEYDVKLLNNVSGSGGIEILNTDSTYFRDTAGWQD